MFKTKDEGKNLYLKVFMIALATSVIIFLPFVIVDRGYFLFYGDFNVQQIPFYQLAHRAIREGNIGFNIYTDLGVNFIGSYSFYLLGSPFFLLTLLFPNAWVPYLMAPLFCLKFAVSALTAFMYIKRFVKVKNCAIVGALCYAFSGFAVYNIFFNHFNDVIAVFPLLLVALEEFIVNKRRGYFAAAVFICSFMNYFFFVGQVVFVILYFFVRCAISKHWLLSIKEFLWLAMEAVLGVLGASVILIPSVLAIIGNPRVGGVLTGWGFLTYPNVQRYGAIIHTLFFPPDLPARPNFFPDADAKWASLGAWLPLFGMTGVFAFFKAKKNNFIKVLLIISLVMALVPGLNSAFFGFNAAYYARWFYMPVLLMAVATAISLDNSKLDFKFGVKWNGILIAIIGVIGIMPIKSGNKWKFGLTPFPERYAVSMMIAALSLLIVYLLINLYRKKEFFHKAVVLSVCFITVVYSMAYIGFGKTHSYESSYVIDDCIEGADKFSLPSDDFFRSDIYDGMDNQLMFLRLPTIQAFHSIVPSSVLKFYDKIGIERGVATRPDASFYGLRTLTSVRYQFIKEDANSPYVVPGFEYMNTQNGYKIYENTNFVPMGFTYDYYATEDQLLEINETSRDRYMLKAIILTPEQEEKYSGLMTKINNQNIYSDLDISTLKADCDVLRKDSGTSFKETKTGFISNITLSRKNLVFYSIPYDEGFSVTIDGQPAEIENVSVGFMAVCVPEGEHTIEFTYKTPGLRQGALISLGAVIVFAAYILISRRNKKLRGEVIYTEDAEIMELTDDMPELSNSGFRPLMDAVSEAFDFDADKDEAADEAAGSGSLEQRDDENGEN